MSQQNTLIRPHRAAAEQDPWLLIDFGHEDRQLAGDIKFALRAAGLRTFDAHDAHELKGGKVVAGEMAADISQPAALTVFTDNLSPEDQIFRVMQVETFLESRRPVLLASQHGEFDRQWETMTENPVYSLQLVNVQDPNEAHFDVVDFLSMRAPDLYRQIIRDVLPQTLQ